jgi:hypothetical protein
VFRWRGVVARSAYRLDAWLKDKVGRPYTMILGVGLILGIAQTVRSIEAAWRSNHSPLLLAGTLFFELALLLNQFAQLHEYREHSRRRRAQSKSA